MGNEKTTGGWSAVTYAVANGRVDALKILLLNGAIIDDSSKSLAQDENDEIKTIISNGILDKAIETNQFDALMKNEDELYSFILDYMPTEKQMKDLFEKNEFI